MDSFVDQGAMVPTITLQGDICTRVYRKGEANPNWDEELARLQYAITKLGEADRQELLGHGRTRIAKIAAIMAMSSNVPTTLVVGSLERGNVGMLRKSVVERDGGEVTGLLRRLGQLK
jgi:hypothetical protein